MDSRRMNISKYHSLVMDVAHSITELSEDGDSLMQVEGPLAETFPRADVVRSLTRKLQEATLHLTVVKVAQIPRNVQ